MGLFDIFRKKKDTKTEVNVEVLYPQGETAPITDNETAEIVKEAPANIQQTNELKDQVDLVPKNSDVEGQTKNELKPETKEISVTDVSEDITETDHYEKGLEKSRQSFGEKLNAFFAKFRTVDEDFFEELEDTLIQADVGYQVAMRISDELRNEAKLQKAKNKNDLKRVIVDKLIEIYQSSGNGEDNTMHFAPEGPTIILFVGVNGVGKTTTIGKLANLYHQQDKKVLLAAADTFRAGATEQLIEWANRDHVDIVTGAARVDPASVVFDAVKKAKNENYDILFVDTAGRLQNNVNLMQELAKMKRIITRELPQAPHEVLIVLDATTGQNAIQQAKLFKESTDVTGIVLTKLDGTAKGGIVLAIRDEMHLPVKWVGLGEKASDLRPFMPEEFVKGLYKGLID
ncbi:signal recognition particle-docking protein FtsY [Periweissella beninensis]|uniref:signal recognition particle-docking protein FtsY n=1 Tax=Periweissella beninensis TaxID=504936 RepID=UPI0021A3DD55|nr:signal recognition particle-docking protein FtsY [Periweissella beninensis]MCT4396807.1 signal recognition particle-docking protein FtsY [Periweissella beninensis]